MSFIQRTDADALIPVNEVQGIFKGLEEKSIAMQLFTRLPNLTAKQSRLAVLQALPVAYWQAADNSKKKLTKLVWEGKYLVAEELAVIVPIPEAVLDDSAYDIWGEVKPKLIEAFAEKIDDAMIAGIDTPSSWGQAIVKAAIAKGHSFGKGSDFRADGNKALDLVESDGFNATALVGGANINSPFRSLVSTDGHPIVGTELQGLPRYRVLNGALQNSASDIYFIVGDFKQAVYAIRQDVTFKILSESIIQDPSDGTILYNLAQDDMVALRAVMRVAYQLPNPVNRVESDSDARLPFAVCLNTGYKLVLTMTPGTATSFATSQVVSLSCDVSGAKIYYTNDGSTPDATKTLYSAPFTLEATKTIKAIAIFTGHTSSDVVSVTFTKSN